MDRKETDESLDKLPMSISQNLPPDVMARFLNRTAQVESGNNPDASNPAPDSTASGLYGFTTPTWKSILGKYPDAGLTMADKHTAGGQTTGLKLMADNEYAPQLASLGIAHPSDADLYRMHFFGAPTASKLMRANPSARASQALGKSWSQVFGNNASMFGNNPDITAGQALGAVDSRYEGVSSPASAPAFAAPESLPTGQTDTPSAPIQAIQAPDAGKPLVDPNAGEGSIGRLLTYLAGWGSGANGEDAAAGLGQGVANGMQALANQRAESQSVQQYNRQLAQQSFENQIKAQQANLGARTSADQHKQAMAQLGLTKTQQTIDLQNIDLQRRAGALAAQKTAYEMNRPQYGDAQSYMAPSASGNGVDRIQVVTDQKTGRPMVMNLSTGRQIGAIPQGAYQASDPGAADVQKASQSDVEAARTDMRGNSAKAVQYNQLLSDLPHVAAGPGVGKALARTYMKATGGNIANFDAGAQQRSEMAIKSMGVDAIHALSGLGRLDLPEVKQALGATASMDATNPANLYALTKERLNQMNYKDGILKAWDSLPKGDVRRLQGFSKFNTDYLNDDATAYRPTDIMGNVAAYNQQNSPSSAAVPVSAAPASRVGPAQGITGTTSGGHSWSFTPD